MTTSIERDLSVVLNAGFAPKLHLEKLRAVLFDSIRGPQSAYDSARLIIATALEEEPGAPLKQSLLGVTLTASGHRTPITQLDASLQPYYGFVRGALRDLVEFGVSPPYADHWQNWFLVDSPVYRVSVACCVCSAAALLVTGRSARFGSPTKAALAYRPAPTSPPAALVPSLQYGASVVHPSLQMTFNLVVS